LQHVRTEEQNVELVFGDETVDLGYLAPKREYDRLAGPAAGDVAAVKATPASASCT
jgi:hypothetical protein